jgi:hypothetical protein
MKKIYIVACVAALLAGPALAESSISQQPPSQGSQAQAGGVNYSTVTQVGVNNVAGVAQSSDIDGSLNDLRSMKSMNSGNINVDSQAYVIGSNVNSAGATISSVNSNNVGITNKSNANAATIIAPLQ